VLDDGARRDVAGRGGRRRPGELRALDRNARHRSDQLFSDHHEEAQDDGIAVAPPRRRVDEDRRPDDVADDPIDDLDRVLRRAELEDPRLRSVRAGQEDPAAVQPDDEHLGLDRAVDIPTGGFATHGAIVFMPGPVGLVP
jgi:hypothetical protein